MVILVTRNKVMETRGIPDHIHTTYVHIPMYYVCHGNSVSVMRPLGHRRSIMRYSLCCYQRYLWIIMLTANDMYGSSCYLSMLSLDHHLATGIERLACHPCLAMVLSHTFCWLPWHLDVSPWAGSHHIHQDREYMYNHFQPLELDVTGVSLFAIM